MFKLNAQISICMLYLFFRQQFRAQPMNDRIFEKVVGVKKAPVRPLTQPATPHLELRRRATAWGKHTPDEEHYEFHANPVPKDLLKGPTVRLNQVCCCVITDVDCVLAFNLWSCVDRHSKVTS